jgi:hypothetical protein
MIFSEMKKTRRRSSCVVSDGPKSGRLTSDGRRCSSDIPGPLLMWPLL